MFNTCFRIFLSPKGKLSTERDIVRHIRDIVTHHIDQLGEAQTHLDGQAVRVVAHGSDEAIVVAQQVVVESLCIWVGQAAGGEV